MNFPSLSFWSIARVFPHIAVGVSKPADYEYVKNCGLPFVDILEM